MNATIERKDPGFGTVLVFSTILHAAFYAALSYSHMDLKSVADQVYYVDVVNLPVAHPRAGAPSADGASRPAPSPEAPHEMKLPAPAAKVPTPSKKASPSPAKPASPSAGTTAGSSAEFEERMAKLERAAEERRQEAAMNLLRQRVGVGSGRAGIPKGTGTEAGSDYASYIQSRLYDAFKLPKTLQAKDPQVLVQLTINKVGRVAEYRIQRTTGDRAFEDAVARAIANAERNFRPPPNNQNFVQNFLFTSDSVGKK